MSYSCREADSAMTDVARRREATAGSRIGSRADKASTPDRKPLEALKAAAAAPGPDAESAMTDVPCAGSRIGRSARSSQSSSTRSQSRFRDEGLQRKPDHRIGNRSKPSRQQHQEPKPFPRWRTSLPEEAGSPDWTERSKLSRQQPVWIRKRFRKDGRCSPPTRQGRHAKEAGSEGAGSSQSSSRSEGGAGQERKLEAQAVHSAHGPCDQNRRQGKGNPEEHSQPIGYGPEADKGQGARKSRQTEWDLKVKERARAPGGRARGYVQKRGGQKRVYRTPESGVTSWRRIRLLLAVLAE